MAWLSPHKNDDEYRYIIFICLNTYKRSWTMNAVLYFSKICLKDIWRRIRKENAREESQDIRLSMAGTGEEEAVWTLHQTVD